MLGRKSRRRLCLESLETRRVLSGTTGVCEAPAPPPPQLDAQVITRYSTNHIRVRDASGGVFVNIERRNTPQNGDAVPFVTGDFNGDGVTDLLGVDSADDWWLHVNDGTRLYEVPVGPGLGNSQLLSTGDFNGDGRLDLVSYDPQGELWVSSNQVDGFEQEYWGEFWNPQAWSDLHVGDFNGDGRLDVLGGEVGGHWWLAQNQDGTDFDNYRWGRYPDFGWTRTLSGDFTGDGIDDIAALAPDQTWWLWEGSATGMTNARYFGHWKMRESFANIEVGDFNGDQVDDVIGRSPDGRLWVGTATAGGFQTWSWGTGWIDTANWSTTILDINQDGMADQVGHAADDTWWYALSTGNTFRNSFWQKGGAGDFVVQGFKPSAPVDLIATFPQGGQDTRNLQLSASLNPQHQIVIDTNQPVEITELTLASTSGGLVVSEQSIPAPFDSFRLQSETRVNFYNSPGAPIVLDGPLTLDIGWHPDHQDLTVTVRVAGSGFLTYPVAVPEGIGHELSSDLTTSELNHNYFDTIPLSSFVHSNQGFSSSGVEPQTPTADGFVSVVDGRLALNGSFSQLAGLEVTSAGGYLSLETVEIPPLGEVPLANPFSPADGVIVRNTPQLVVIGVLGASKRVNVEGLTLTSILYSGPVGDVAQDVRVQIGMGDSPPAALQVGSEPTSGTPQDPAESGTEAEHQDNSQPEGAEGTQEDGNATSSTPDDSQAVGDGYVRIVDGRLTFHGTFSQLAGILVQSRGGYLALDEVEYPGGASLSLRDPFPVTAVVVNNNAHEIAMGVLGAANRIDLEGVTSTAILYSASEETARDGDLKVFVGLDDNGPALVSWE